MNKKAQTHYHFDLRNIPIFIWIVLVAIVCIILGNIAPGLENLKFIGEVIFIIWVGALLIDLYQRYS